VAALALNHDHLLALQWGKHEASIGEQKKKIIHRVRWDILNFLQDVPQVSEGMDRWRILRLGEGVGRQRSTPQNARSRRNIPRPGVPSSRFLLHSVVLLRNRRLIGVAMLIGKR
jgi:hypothetical protein